MRNTQFTKKALFTGLGVLLWLTLVVSVKAFTMETNISNAVSYLKKIVLMDSAWTRTGIVLDGNSWWLVGIGMQPDLDLNSRLMVSGWIWVNNKISTILWVFEWVQIWSYFNSDWSVYDWLQAKSAITFWVTWYIETRNDISLSKNTGQIVLSTNWNVGISNENPQYKLEVNWTWKFNWLKIVWLANSFLWVNSQGNVVSTWESDPTVNVLAKATLACTNWQVAKYNWSAWVCSADVDTDTNTIPVAACQWAANKVTWNWSAFACETDQTWWTYTEADPVFVASAANWIKNTNVTNWNASYSASHIHFNFDTLNSITSTAGRDAASTWVTNNSWSASNWNTAYWRWNHTTQGYLKSSDNIASATYATSAGSATNATYATSAGSATNAIDTTASSQTKAGNLIIGGTITASAFLYSSDKRLKKDLVKIVNPLDKILALNWYTFKWNKNGKKDVWVLAQEVEKQFPELVENGTNGYKAVKYWNLIAPVIEAIKEFYAKYIEWEAKQQKEIDMLKATVQELKAQVAKLSAK